MIFMIAEEIDRMGIVDGKNQIVETYFRSCR